MKNALLLLVMLAGLLSACEDKYKDPDPTRMGYEYYPLEIGDYRIYNVTDIKFKADVGDTTRFQMREVVVSSFVDQTNTVNHKVVRSIRADESQSWVEDSVIVVSKSDLRVLQTKNNTKYIKLVFPVRQGKTWAGDSFNDHTVNDNEKEIYSYSNIGDSFTVNGVTYQNTATVIQGSPRNDLLILDDRKEVYAKGVGAVYRLFNKVTFCNDYDSKECEFGVGFKLNGHERHEELISYGNE